MFYKGSQSLERLQDAKMFASWEWKVVINMAKNSVVGHMVDSLADTIGSFLPSEKTETVTVTGKDSSGNTVTIEVPKQ